MSDYAEKPCSLPEPCALHPRVVHAPSPAPDAGTGNELRERLETAAWEGVAVSRQRTHREVVRDSIAAVLPIIEAAVTEAEERARREALEEAAQIIEQSGSKDPNLRSVTAWLKARAAGGPK